MATLEGATHQEQERFKAAIAHEFQRQQHRQQQDTSAALSRDQILEAEIISLKAQLKEQFKKQDAEWQQVLNSQDDRASLLLEQQKANAEQQKENNRQEARDFLDKQRREFEGKIQALTERIDRAERTTYTVPPTEAFDGDAGPSNRGQIDSCIPHDIPTIAKQSASTPKQNKGKEVDQGGNNQQPPPLPSNIDGNPDPDPSDHDNDDDKNGDDGRGRRGGRPERNAQKPSIPRDTSPRTRGILQYLQQLGTPMRSVKNAAEPPYLFQRDDNQDVRNWLTACEDYFDHNPQQWENHANRIVFALGKTKGNKVAPFAEKY